MERELSNAFYYAVTTKLGESNRVNFVIRVTFWKVLKSTPNLGLPIELSVFPTKASF